MVDEAGKLKVILVRTGLTDGTKTEIRQANPAQNLEGLKVILREKVTAP